MKIQFAMILLVLLNTINSEACEYHNVPNFGVFGQFHPFAQRHIHIPQRTEIRVDHDKQVAVKTGTQAQLQLRYFVPLEYADTEVTITTSKDLVISNKLPFALTKTQGNANITFHATLTGEHSLLINIYATLNNKPYFKIQRISVISS
jgi:hypothetical protein